MCLALEKRLGDFTAAIPCRYTAEHPLYQYRLEGNDNFFSRQLPWERHYLEFASVQGCIIFWLPEESVAQRRSDGLPYAMDTRGELGEWRWRMRGRARVVLGGEAGFPGLDAIRRNLDQALGYGRPDYRHPFASSIEELVDFAAARVNL
jgi:hypothetical protein